MNILFFLSPKSEVTVVRSDMLVDEVIKLMRKSSYVSLPVIDKNGRYIGTLTQGDLLWYLYDSDDPHKAALSQVKTVPRSRDNASVSASADMESLFNKMLQQNFAPVTDDRGLFIGIVTRRSIMKYFLGSIDAPLDAEK